jgi:alkylation response protein AidB-like acyl-CoA dehydrogenase
MSCLVTTLMNNSAERLLVSLLPREIYEQVYRNGPGLIAGSSQPGGAAEAADRGWRVNGRWPFVSGCQDADWMLAICVMTEDGKPLPGPAREAGPPLARDFFLPAGKLLPGERNHHV